MREHIRILGILNIIMGCLVALVGIVALAVLGGVAGFVASGANDADSFAPAPVLAAIGIGVAIFFLIIAAPSIIGGWALLAFKPWSRILMIIVSIFHLFHIPLGTALGVYGLWVLFSDEAKWLLENGGHAYVPPAPYPAATPLRPQQPIYPPPGV